MILGRQALWSTRQPASARRKRGRVALSVLSLGAFVAFLSLPASVESAVGTADEVHYTFTGPTSVAFDWRGTATDVRYGLTTSYGNTATAHTPDPLPFSSSGPFEEAEVTGLAAGTIYHYSIGGGTDQTMTTAPTGSFRFDVEADVGASTNYHNMPTIQGQIAADQPSFVLVVGDLTYGNDKGQVAVDQHFNDVMVWSEHAAYMPAWGNHEWDTATDDLRNYKGRFVLPHPQSSSAAPAVGCCGEDWSWFDSGGVRFISYPEPYDGDATWTEWQTNADAILAAAQADPSIHFIVTFGHRAAYSTGHHPGDAGIAAVLDTFGDRYSKYVLNLNGHSHDYERFQPIHGVTHITASGGGATLEPPWTSTDPRTAFRAMHQEHLRVDVSKTGMQIESVCGPATTNDDITCTQGSVIDSYTIGTPSTPPPSLDHIVLSPASATVAAGGSQTYTAQGFDASNNSLGDVTASTAFSIGPNGSCSGNVCTATTAGAHTVTGNDSGKTATASLSVTAGPLDHLALSPASATINAGASQSYTAQGRDKYDNPLGDVTSSTAFSIAPNGSCTGATCTASSSGAHTVTGTSGGKTGSASLQVNTGGLDHVVISPGSATIGAGAPQSYTAQGFDSSNNSLGDVTSGTVFSISPNGSCAGNVCTATIAGSHTVTGNDAGKTSTASLSVTAGPLDHLALSPATATVAAGGSQAYTAQARDRYDNSLGDVTPSTVFSIAPNGSCSGATCTATIAGPHTVTGTDSGKTGTAALAVNTGPLDHLALSPASATINVGGSQAYTAQGRDRYENSLGDVTSSTTFSIAPNGSCAGATCTASAAGTHTVTGTDSGKTGAATLQVNAAGTLDHIVISPASATISATGAQAYTAQGFDSSNRSLGDVTASTVFSIAPNGSCSANVCSATIGGPHTVTGNDSGKASTASLAVSFVANPGFETNTTGWNGTGTGVVVARVAGGHSGGWAVRVSNTGTTTTSCTLNDSPDWVKPTSAGTFTGSIWARADAAGATLKLRFREWSTSGTLLGSATSQVTLTTAWQQVVVSYVVKSPGSTLDFQAYDPTAPPGVCFYADDAAILLS